MPTKTIIRRVVKVAPKKRTATAIKKTSSKKQTQGKALVCASEGECFWTHDGKVLRNLADLNYAFQAMEDGVFTHHVNKDKNDFADWVDHILQDGACAKELRKAKKIAQAKKVTASHLKTYAV